MIESMALKLASVSRQSSNNAGPLLRARFNIMSNILNSLVESVLINLDKQVESKLVMSVCFRIDAAISSEVGKAEAKGTSSKRTATSGAYTKASGAVLRFSETETTKFEARNADNPALALDALINYINKGMKQRLISVAFTPSENILPEHVSKWMRELIIRVEESLKPAPKPEPETASKA